MTKAINLNDTEELEGFPILPDGVYEATVTGASVELKPETGNIVVKFIYTVKDDGSDHTIWNWTTLSRKSAGRFKRTIRILLEANEYDENEITDIFKEVSYQSIQELLADNAFIKAKVKVKVTSSEYNGKTNNKIDRLLDPNDSSDDDVV